MSDLSIIQRKIKDIQRAKRILLELSKYPLAEIKNTPILKGAVERYLFILTQATIDLASARVAYEKLNSSDTYSGNFYILAEHKIIPPSLAEKLKPVVGTRNILVHQYAMFDLEYIFKDLHQNLKVITSFVNRVKKYLML